MRTLLYPGSFDPITLGHLDIIQRGAKLCDRLVVAVLHNPGKKGTIEPQKRAELIRKACRGIGNVVVTAEEGLTIECAARWEADAILRGIRPLGDFENEFTMAQLNRRLGHVETLMMTTSQGVGDISSSAVREIASFGGDIAPFVPEGMAQDILDAMKK